MLGAHFDSHHGATGATDNATGSVAMIEAMRILKAVGREAAANDPRRALGRRRTGAHGIARVREAALRRSGDHADEARIDKLSAYFNLDNGTGKIRGIWYQGNLGVRPVFEQWIAPLKDLGVEILGPRVVGSTDHAAFEAVGLPGFQFVQERLEYNSRTHHSNMDFVDRVQREDLVQQATVAAAFAFMAAQRDEKLPQEGEARGRGVVQYGIRSVGTSRMCHSERQRGMICTSSDVAWIFAWNRGDWPRVSDRTPSLTSECTFFAK